MSLDKATGRWQAKLGRKKTKSGKSDGHKFRFSADKKESERRKSAFKNSGMQSLIAMGRTLSGTKLLLPSQMPSRKESTKSRLLPTNLHRLRQSGFKRAVIGRSLDCSP